MEENPHDPLERALDSNFLGTEERHISEPHRTRPCRRECRCEVRGRREDDAHDIVDGQPIALKHRREQFAHRLMHFDGVVGDEADRSTDGSHAGSLQTRLGVERTQFRPFDRSQPTRTLLIEANWADASANEVLHRIPNMVEHTPDNTVSSFVNDDLNHRSISGLLNNPRAVAFDDAILQRNPLPKSPQGLLRELTADSSYVRLENFMGRMSEAIRKLTVICKDEQALGIGIQPTDVEQSLWPILDVVTDTRPATIINHRRDDTARFVKRNNDDVGHRQHSLAIHADDCGERVDPHSLLCNDHSVYFDPALFDELLAPAAAPDAGEGKNLLQSNPIVIVHDALT